MSDSPGAREERKVFRRQTPPGAMPGTIRTDPEAPHPVIRVMVIFFRKLGWLGAGEKMGKSEPEN